MKTFLDINLDQHLEKKGKLDYLPWAVVWREIIQIHPEAKWYVHEFNGMPLCYIQDGTAFVKTTIYLRNTAVNECVYENEKTCWLPVMDSYNKAIKNPNAFDVNKTIMRCLVKTAAMFGLGLNVYNGETFNEATQEAPKPKVQPKPEKDPKEARLAAENWVGQQQKVLVQLDADGIAKWKSDNAATLKRLEQGHKDLYDNLMDGVG